MIFFFNNLSLKLLKYFQSQTISSFLECFLFGCNVLFYEMSGLTERQVTIMGCGLELFVFLFNGMCQCLVTTNEACHILGAPVTR